MEKQRNQWFHSSSSSDTRNLCNMVISNNPLFKFRSFKRNILKFTIIPFAVVSTTFLTGFTNKAYAQTFFQKNIDTYKKPTDWSGADVILPDAVIQTFETIDSINQWFRGLPERAVDFTFNIMSEVYGLITDLILKTPLWLFDNNWFENTTYLMSLIAISVVTVLTSFEGIKRQVNKQSMDLHVIAKRWFIVAGLSSIVPFLLKKGFQFINWISEQITGLSSFTMTNVLQQPLVAFGALDSFILLLFNVVMIGLAIPILLKNARRFFDILTLGIISPLAGVAYIYDSYNHLFKQWWESLKSKSLVQIVYAFYLLLIGLFIFGVPVPPTVEGMALKTLITIGGLYRLANPPMFIKNNMNFGKSITEMKKEVGDTTDKVKEGYGMGRSFFNKTTGITKNLIKAANPEPHVVDNPNSRMSVIHGRRNPVQHKSRMGKFHGKY